jgi:uncharacterized protein (TIGR03086 family)
MTTTTDAGEHRVALAGFTAVVRHVPGDAWQVPTPCGEWDAAALVEHVIGFHEFLLLAPLGVRAHRPRAGSLARWLASERAIHSVLDDPDALDRPTSYFDGATRRPAELLPALADDTLVHTWDLARAVGRPDRLDAGACDRAYANARRRVTDAVGSELYAPPVAVSAEAPVQERLLGLLGRDPRWGAPS